jgi:hypothetical protein
MELSTALFFFGSLSIDVNSLGNTIELQQRTREEAMQGTNSIATTDY